MFFLVKVLTQALCPYSSKKEKSKRMSISMVSKSKEIVKVRTALCIIMHNAVGAPCFLILGIEDNLKAG